MQISGENLCKPQDLGLDACVWVLQWQGSAAGSLLKWLLLTMVVAELLRWRAPMVLVLLTLLLASNPHLQQKQESPVACVFVLAKKGYFKLAILAGQRFCRTFRGCWRSFCEAARGHLAVCISLELVPYSFPAGWKRRILYRGS